MTSKGSGGDGKGGFTEAILSRVAADTQADPRVAAWATALLAAPAVVIPSRGAKKKGARIRWCPDQTIAQAEAWLRRRRRVG